jgi:hypothetical protein
MFEMKRQFLLFAITVFSSGIFAQNFQWAKSIGGNSSDQATSIAVDSHGNVYSTGYFNETVDFDPGPGTFNLTSAGYDDIFISKLDSSGKFIWAIQIGSKSWEQVNSVDIDDFGNLILTGDFYGTLDFDPGIGVYNLTPLGQRDVFVVKFNSDGKFIWTKSMGGTDMDRPHSISVDASGNIYTFGEFSGNADFDPDTGSFFISNLGGDQDLFISKLDSNGNFIWAKSIGGRSFQHAGSMTLDYLGNIYLTGSFNSTTDFDPGSKTYYLSTNSGINGNIFVCKLDYNGNFVWAKQMAGSLASTGFSISIDIRGQILTTGRFRGTVDFDPGSGSYNLTTTGSDEIFISKLDNNGNFVWAKRFGGKNPDVGLSITTDTFGNVYTTGFFNDTVDFDPGAQTYKLTSGYNKVFISKLDSRGNFVWAKSTGSGWCEGNAIVIDPSGNIYLAGLFYNSGDFDPDTGTTVLASNGVHDVFILKLGSCQTPSGQITGPTAVCSDDSAIFSVNVTPATSGYDWTVPSGATINSGQNSSEINVTFGTIEGNILVNTKNKCGDNTIGQFVKVKPKAQADFSVNDVCESDSVEFLNLSQNSNSFNWRFGNGQFSTTVSPKHFYHLTNGVTTTYFVTFVAKNEGCADSMTKAVTVKANPISDFSFVKSGNKFDFKASQNDNTSYLWKFGNGDSAATTLTDYSYTYSQSNAYNVCLKVISADNCFSQTCKSISTIGISETTNASGMRIYPNPNSGSFEVVFEKTPTKDAEMVVFDLAGRTVWGGVVESGANRIFIQLPETASGIYILRVGGVSRKLVVE